MSALTSLLVRDDVVSVRQIEDALQRQVLEGGELDTALLEQTDLPENLLTAYRAASYRAMPASREEVMGVSAAARSLLIADLATAFSITPITHDATRLVVAGHTPLSDAQCSELASKVGLQVVWRISCEARIEAALAAFYGKALAPRMRELALRIEAADSGEVSFVEPIQATPPAALSAELLQGFDESDDFEAVLEAAFERVSAVPATAVPAAASSAAGSKRSTSPGMPTARTDAPRAAAPGNSNAASALPRRGSKPAQRSATPAAMPTTGRRKSTGKLRPVVERRGDPRIPKGPLTDAIAIKLLAEADVRDTVVEVLFRYARQYFDATVLFTVRDDRAVGLEGYNLQGLADIREVSVPLVRGAALDDLIRSLLPRVVDLSRKDEDRALAQAMERLDCQPGALIPVCIKRRVVSFVYGDRAGDRFALEDLAPLVGLLPHVSRAFERIIRTRKALALNTQRGVRGAHAAELEHAQTEWSEPQKRSASPAPAPAAAQAPSAALPEVARHEGLDLAEARTRQALNSLGVPRPAPPPPAPRSPQRSALDATAVDKALNDAFDPDRLPTDRMHVEPLPAARPSKPPTPYFSKPPPGTGRYSSLRPEASAEPKPSEPARPSSDSPARRSPVPNRARADARVDADAHESSSPATDASTSTRSEAGRSRPPARSSKPPPGAGSYRTQGFTTELISVPKPPSSSPPRNSRSSPRPEGSTASARPSKAPAPWPKSPPPASPLPPVGASTFTRPPPAARSVPPQPMAARDIGHERTIAVDPMVQIEGLIAELCRCEQDREGPIVAKLRESGRAALEPLLIRFPGPLWFDRRRTQARVPLGRDLSAIARALASFGEEAMQRFGPLLRASDADVRYYATLFVSDRVHPSLLEPLIERLFDDDAQIRIMARDILPHYRRVAGFSRVTERLRLQAGDPQALLKARLAAIDAITVLRDAQSVPIMIELLGETDKQLSIPAHRVLVAITCQDFAKSQRKWRSWYQSNADRHRVEWLIAALMHSEQTLRAAAGVELQKITQVYYGFAAAAPKRERESAQKRYQDWWQHEGRTKF